MPAAYKYFKSGITASAQVDTLTFGGTWETNDNVNITLTDEMGVATTLVVVSGSATIATICTTVAAAINAIFTAGTTSSPFYAVLAAAGATTVTLTARTNGVPFYCSVTTTENGGGAADSQTLSRSATTPNVGPSDWNTAANWSDGIVPVATDIVFIDSRAASNSILYGLDQSAVTLGALNIDQGFTGTVGSLTTRLRVSATLFTVGAKPPDGSNPSGSLLINIDLGANASTMLIYGTRNTGTSGQPPLMLKNIHADSTLTIQGSSYVGVSVMIPGEASTIPAITTSSSGLLMLGSACTLTAVTNTGSGVVFTHSAVTTLKSTKGTLTTAGDCTIGTLDAQGGTINLNNRKTGGNSVTTLQMNGATVDVRGDARALTIDATTYAGGRYLQNAAQTTFTAVSFAFTEAADGTFSVPA